MAKGSDDSMARQHGAMLGPMDFFAPAPPPRSADMLAPGLTVAATPIGHLGDVSLRLQLALATAEIIACEDTRRTRQLLAALGLNTDPRRVMSCHAHNEAARVPLLLAALGAGRKVLLVSDAGTPLLSDPGRRLVAAARAAGHTVRVLPGPSAITAALSISGLAVERFCFLGFLPRRAGERQAILAPLAALPTALVLFEAPKRLAATLRELAAMFGVRAAAVCRELTKHHEEVALASLAELAQRYATAVPKGEIVIVVAPPDPNNHAAAQIDMIDVDAALRHALARESLRDAVRSVAHRSGIRRQTIYQRALALQGDPQQAGKR